MYAWKVKLDGRRSTAVVAKPDEELVDMSQTAGRRPPTSENCAEDTRQEWKGMTRRGALAVSIEEEAGANGCCYRGIIVSSRCAR